MRSHCKGTRAYERWDSTVLGLRQSWCVAPPDRWCGCETFIAWEWLVCAWPGRTSTVGVGPAQAALLWLQSPDLPARMPPARDERRISGGFRAYERAGKTAVPCDRGGGSASRTRGRRLARRALPARSGERAVDPARACSPANGFACRSTWTRRGVILRLPAVPMRDLWRAA